MGVVVSDGWEFAFVSEVWFSLFFRGVFGIMFSLEGVRLVESRIKWNTSFCLFYSVVVVCGYSVFAVSLF